MAILLLISFVFFAVICRILIQYYYTGDHGIRLAKANAPCIEILPGTVFIISFIINMCLIILNYIGKFPVDIYFSPIANAFICLLGFLGIIIMVIAQIQMGSSWRIGVDQSEKTDLMVTGLYSKSRNPIYFGLLIYCFSISLIVSHPAILACTAVCWFSIELIIRKVEEPYLKRVHGAAFDKYCLKTKRYLIW